ncbi:MAG: (2Fe-2S)-binding protein [Burkholderiales bacterium]|nr:(2Fe-2S)-binding protein [Burkholderiales bacterium]MDQ3196205.1 (2Fe-2S)-binding protein [Pseudomonadota bacterium]
MYICLCYGITDQQIRECVEHGACSLQDLREQLGVASCCGRCSCYAEDVLCDALRNKLISVETKLLSAA